MSAQIVRLQSIDKKLGLLDEGLNRLNVGGLLELYCIIPSDISSFPTYNFSFDSTKEAKASGDIDLLADSEVYVFRFTPATGGFTEKMSEDIDGVYYEQLLSISIPKDHPALTWIKQTMRRRRFLFIYRDSNGLIKLLNKQNEGARVKFDLQIGNKSTDFNHTSISILRNSRTPAIFWDIPLQDNIIDHINIL